MRDDEIIDHVDSILRDIKELDVLIDELTAERQRLQDEYNEEMSARFGAAWPAMQKGGDE